MGHFCTKDADDSAGHSSRHRRDRHKYDSTEPASHEHNTLKSRREGAGLRIEDGVFGPGVGALAVASRPTATNGCSTFFVGSENGNICEVSVDLQRLTSTPAANDPAVASVTRRWTAHAKDINKLLFVESTGVLYSASRDKMIVGTRVQADGAGEKPGASPATTTFSGHELNVTCVAVSPPGDLLFSGSRDNTVRLWDTERGHEIARDDTKLNIVHCCQWVPELSVVAQGGEDLTIRLWDVRERPRTIGGSLTLVHTLANFDYHPICCALMGPQAQRGEVPPADGPASASSAATSTASTLVTGHNGFNGHGCMLTTWDLRGRRAVETLFGHENTVRWVMPVPSPPRPSTAAAPLSANPLPIGEIISASDDGTLKRWRIGVKPTGLASSMKLQFDAVASAAFPEGRITCMDWLARDSSTNAAGSPEGDRTMIISTRSGVLVIAKVPVRAPPPEEGGPATVLPFTRQLQLGVDNETGGL